MHSVPGGKVDILGGHSIGRSKQKKKYICTCVIFRTVSERDLFHCIDAKLLIRRRHYVLFLLPVFIVQVTKLVQFTYVVQYILKIPSSTSMHFATRGRT
jgi:hypothetical protein